MKKVGILCGRERSFPLALIDAVRALDRGVDAEMATLDLAEVSAPRQWDVLVDRISHDVPCYQPFLKLAALAGTRLVNNTFWRIADDKAFGTALARRLGVAVPKTYVLPSKEYGDDISAASLHNLRYPLAWDAMIQDLGFPMFTKPHWGGGFKDVSRVTNVDELFRAYDRSGRLTLIAQEGIEWTQYVRCIVIGKREVLPLRWDPRLTHFDRYARAAETMPPLGEELTARIVDDASKLCEALGYDMNTVEFAVRDGVPYAIDFMNSAPDFDVTSLGESAFRWTVDRMADLCVRLAQDETKPAHRWDQFLLSEAQIDRRAGLR